MAQTIANLASVMKDAWTSDRLQKQFYDENPFLKRIESVTATMIGEQAQVPIHSGRSGGFTTVLAAGGDLNPAGRQGVSQALYTMPYLWFQIALETAAINQTQTSMQSVVAAKDLEIEGGLADLAKQSMRMIASDGTGRIAQCDTTTTDDTIVLSATGFGPDAIVRGWLYAGLPVDIGSTSDSDSVVAGAVIQSVDDVNNTITIDSSVTTSTSHYISIANPNSGTVPGPELNGLRNIVATSGSLGGIDPSVAGSEFWKSPKVDTSTTTFTLALALEMQRAAKQKTGKMYSYIATSLKQESVFYELLQNQVRFGGDGALGAGQVNGPKWNNLEVNAFNDIVDREWYNLTIEDFIRITGSITKPTWASDIEGAGGQFRWKQGSTSFSDAVVYPFQVGVQRRNSHTAAVGLTG